MNENFQPINEMNTEGGNATLPLVENNHPALADIEVTHLDGAEATAALELFDESHVPTLSKEGIEVTEITPEEIELGVEIIGDAARVAELSQGEMHNHVVRTAQIYTLGNAFAAAEDTPSSDATMSTATGGISRMSDWVAKKGKGALATIALAAGLGALAPATAEAGIFGNTGAVPASMKSIDGVIRATQEGFRLRARYTEIELEQVRIAKELQRLEEAEKLVLARNAANQRVGEVVSGKELSVKELEMEVVHKKALKQAEDAFYAKLKVLGNPTDQEIAAMEYDAQVARINLEHEKRLIAASGNAAVGTSQMGVNNATAGANASRLASERVRLTNKSQALVAEKAKIISDAAKLGIRVLGN